MNEGKICVSVCAETAEEFIANIKRAAQYADVIELRIDCLTDEEFDAVLPEISVLNIAVPFLATCRPKVPDPQFVFARPVYRDKEHRARKLRDESERMAKWEKILALENVEYVDLEFDLHHLLFVDIFFSHLLGHEPSEQTRKFIEHLKNRKVVLSEHFYDETPADVDLLKHYGDAAELMRILHLKTENKPDFPPIPHALFPPILKIAAQAKDVGDGLILMKYLEKMRNEGFEVVPISMGEAGKWTRILGPALGASMTYAALDAGRETAPGQLTAKELIETYRVRELNENTEIYGLVGRPVSQSVSPAMHNAAFKFHGRDAVYVPFEVEDIGQFVKRFVREETREVDLNFKGFSVTIPHKRSIIEFLDETDETARKIGAVNTVRIENKKLLGFNTDAAGFVEPLKNVYGDLGGARVAVLGAGGAARACLYALQKELAEISLFARDLSKAGSLADEFEADLKELKNADFRDFDILVNTTPLGMKGRFETETPATAGQIENLKLVYDLVYNPFQTRLMNEADKASVPKIGGLAMLVAQAVLQQKIWTGLDAPLKEMSRAALEKLK